MLGRESNASLCTAHTLVRVNQLDSTPTLKHSLLSFIGTKIVNSHCNMSDSTDDNCMDYAGDENDAYHNDIIFPYERLRRL